MGTRAARPGARRLRRLPAHLGTPLTVSRGYGMELLTSADVWIAFATLLVLEIVLGVDNVVFISILAGRLPARQQSRARIVGLTLALITRILLLLSLSWVIGLTAPLFSVGGHQVSGRDLILLAGGAFLVVKSTHEMHRRVEGAESHEEGRGASSFASVLVAIALMMALARTISEFVNRHPTVRMLALAFLLLIGGSLIADGLHYHIPKGYIYGPIAFSVFVEAMNLWAGARTARRRARAAGVDTSAEAFLEAEIASGAGAGATGPQGGQWAAVTY
jgi:predicted tellurium resistance membrane protein TerC